MPISKCESIQPINTRTSFTEIVLEVAKQETVAK
jgi:hypothetical protein